jgi:hypothetical protein
MERRRDVRGEMDVTSSMIRHLENEKVKAELIGGMRERIAQKGWRSGHRQGKEGGREERRRIRG